MKLQDEVRMAVTVEMQNTGDSDLKADVVASVEHALADRPGESLRRG